MGWWGPEVQPICKRGRALWTEGASVPGATVLPTHPPVPTRNSNLTCPLPKTFGNQGPPPHIQDPAWPTPKSRKQGQGYRTSAVGGRAGAHRPAHGPGLARGPGGRSEQTHTSVPEAHVGCSARTQECSFAIDIEKRLHGNVQRARLQRHRERVWFCPYSALVSESAGKQESLAPQCRGGHRGTGG